MKRLKIILQYNVFYYSIFIISLIYLIVYISLYDCKHIYNEKDNTFYIKILSYKINDNRLKIKTNNLVCYYSFNSNDEKNSFLNNYSIGDIIKVYGRLIYPNNNTIPNTFNYKEYLYHNNIEFILNIKSFSKKENNKNIFYYLKNTIYKRINTVDNNEYLYAFILGDTSNIDDEANNSYKINGIMHLYAISSLHVSLLSTSIFRILRKIKVSYNNSFIIVFIFLFFYSFVVGFSPSILRAFIYFNITKLFKILKIKTNKRNILLLTISILLFINPNYIYNNGFILSIIINYFLLLSNNKSLLKINTICFISSFPIIINMFYEINVLSIISNLLFIPFVTKIVFPLSIICLLLPKLIIVLKILTNVLEIISIFMSKYFSYNIIFQKLNIIEIIIYYLLLRLCFKNKQAYKYLILFVIFIYIKPNITNEKFVYFIDVKQGDSILIHENNTNLLIDSGGIIEDDKTVNSSLIPFFKSIGIKQIDYLITTHGDYDHMGYSIDIVNNFKVDKVIFNCGEFNDLENNLIKVLDKKNIKYYSCIKELNIDNNKLYFLQIKYYDNENDNSNVIYTELNGYKFMFMGDASVTTEKEILDKYNLSDIDVLKVGHHGSKTSSSKEFIYEINPRYSIISVGKNNRYGHPNKETLDNLNNSKIYRTDEDGSIMFKIKNNKLNIEICNP